MRRWIFAVLLLANVGMLLWGFQYIEPERPARARAYEELNPETMRLLREVPRAKLVPRPRPAPPPPPAVSVVTGQTCYRIGPLVDADQIASIEDALQKQALVFTRRDEVSTSVTAYRVYLPPLASREEAEQKRRELTQLGFNDHAVMQEEGYRNAVSLGLFSMEANAQSHLRRLVQAGVVAAMQPIEQRRTATWLELHPSETAGDIAERLKVVSETVSSLPIGEIACPAPVTPPPNAQ